MNYNNQTIANIVANDYRTAAVFSKHKIDFCCKGGRPLETVCKDANIDMQEIIGELVAATTDDSVKVMDYQHLPLDLLIDFIEKKFHREIREKTPIMLGYLEKVATVHGKAYNELYEIYRLFVGCANELEAHMQKEEKVLFPYIKQLFAKETPEACFPTIQAPIGVMKHEHEAEGDRFRRIAELSSNYTPPQGACNTYKVAYAMLNEFEQDLHLHIHLENNILFPQAIELEKQGTLVG